MRFLIGLFLVFVSLMFTSKVEAKQTLNHKSKVTHVKADLAVKIVAIDSTALELAIVPDRVRNEVGKRDSLLNYQSPVIIYMNLLPQTKTSYRRARDGL